MIDTTSTLGRIAALGLAAASPAAELPVRKVLPTEVAQQIAAAALRKCQAQGFAISVTVVDSGGALLAFARHQDAGLHTIEASRRKAYTALAFRSSTADFATLVDRHPEAVALRDLADVTTLSGGLPILSGKEVIGGVGVGGAPGGALDSQCAQAGLDSAEASLGRKSAP